MGLWCLTLLLTILQLYRGGHFYCWRKPECPQKTTELFRISILYCHKYMNIECTFCMRMIFYCLSNTCMLQMISYFSYLFYNITKWNAHWLGAGTFKAQPVSMTGRIWVWIATACGKWRLLVHWQDNLLIPSIQIILVLFEIFIHNRIPIPHVYIHSLLCMFLHVMKISWIFPA